MNDWYEFGRFIRDLRERANMTQQGAADRGGISRQHWNRIELGHSGVGDEGIEGIAKAFEGLVEGRKAIILTELLQAASSGGRDFYEAVNRLLPKDPVRGSSTGPIVPSKIPDETMEPGELALQAFYRGAPEAIRGEILRAVARIVIEHQKGDVA